MKTFTSSIYFRTGAAAAALMCGQALQAQDTSVAEPTAPVGTAMPGDAETSDQAAAASDSEIVVTARRRNELLLDVPIAVTAYSAEQLDRQGALDITDIADTTPNVTLEVSRGTNSTLTPFIRGVGQQDPVAGFEQGVGLYLDDVYFNRPQAAVLNIYDVERIEILRGPQGTLYGRNTIGGAIKYVTRRIRPDGPHFDVRTNLGTHGQFDLIASASTPLTGGLLVGIAGARLTNTGFGKNLTNGLRNYDKDILAVRGTVELVPSERVFVRLAGDYTWDDSNPKGGHRLVPNLCTVPTPTFSCVGNLPVLDDVFDTRGSLNDPKQKVRAGGVSLWAEIGLNDWLKFRNITAYRKDKANTPIDFDATPFPDVDVPAIYKNRQFSQELQLVADNGPLQGVAGLYYLKANAYNIFDVRLYTTSPTLAPGFTQGTIGDVDTKTWAIFGDFSYDFTPQWSLSLGGRFTNDKRSVFIFKRNYVLGGQPELGGSFGFGTGLPAGAPLSNFRGSRTDKAFTPRASIGFKPTPDHNLYLSYSKGFKGGGFDPRGNSSNAPGDTPTTPPTEQQIYDFLAFDPEKVDSFELGWKASLFNRRLQLATAVFTADYKDVQVPGSSPCTTIVLGLPVNGFCGVTRNAGKARMRGVEIEAHARVAQDMAISGDRLNFAGTLGYLDGKYLEFITNIPGLGPVDVADNRKIQNTPKWTLSGTVDYDTPAFGGRLNLNSTVAYRSSSQQGELANALLDQPGFALWDANATWRSADKRWELGLHGKNLTNKEYIVSGYPFLAVNPITGAFVTGPTGQPISALGKTGTATAFYGNPRQLFVSAAFKF